MNTLDNLLHMFAQRRETVIRTVMTGIVALFIAVYTPTLLLEMPSADEKQDYLLILRENDHATADKTQIYIDIRTENGIEHMLLDEYLVGVVLSEMPASFELEALKAQAVAARTFALRQKDNSKHGDCDLCSDSSCCQAWTSKAAIETKLGDSFEYYWKKGEMAVRKTENEVIYYNEKLIDAVYFSCSGGFTEDAIAVWGNDVPYLRSVESPGEENAKVYESKVVISAEEFARIIRSEQPEIDLSGNPSGWFGNIERTTGNGVKFIAICGHKFTGIQFRKMFGLKSTCFFVSLTEEGIVFSVRGYGHRIGMSQYGANSMAKQGRTYQEILLHYYTGVEIKKHP